MTRGSPPGSQLLEWTIARERDVTPPHAEPTSNVRDNMGPGFRRGDVSDGWR